MADDEQNKRNLPEKSYFTENYDPSLDFYSEHFDPLKALQSSNIKIPVPNSQVYDNIAKYESARRVLPTESKAKVKEKAPVFERKFQAHQMPVKSERVFKIKNINTKMESFEGPLALLKKCVDERIRIKVFTRYPWGIRGYCLAFVAAFDKHWNIALEDVTEVWTRKKKRKVAALGSLNVSEAAAGSSKRRIVPPKIIITKTTSKLEYCERYVPQLIIRGEQVAFINLIQ